MRSKNRISYSLLCPQCGTPTDGSLTLSGGRSSFCEDCVGDRDIDEAQAGSLGRVCLPFDRPA
jgi:hypothetical protein